MVWEVLKFLHFHGCSDNNIQCYIISMYEHLAYNSVHNLKWLVNGNQVWSTKVIYKPVMGSAIKL